MVDQIKILTARRALEFQPDDIRLTLLSVDTVMQSIQQAFAFKTSIIGEPLEMFGPVPKTLPPGVIFNWGSIAHLEGKITPIRFIHFEQRRVVIDIVGQSSTLELIIGRLLETLNDVQTPDGMPALGTPLRTLDWSEITAHFRTSPTALLRPSLLKLYRRILGDKGNLDTLAVTPLLRVHATAKQEEYPGGPSKPEHQAFSLEIRKGTLPEAGMYYSAAPLTTEAHIAYLMDLESALASPSD